MCFICLQSIKKESPRVTLFTTEGQQCVCPALQGNTYYRSSYALCSFIVNLIACHKSYFIMGIIRLFHYGDYTAISLWGLYGCFIMGIIRLFHLGHYTAVSFRALYNTAVSFSGLYGCFI